MTDVIDILMVDTLIRKNFSDEYERLSFYRDKQIELSETLKNISKKKNAPIIAKNNLETNISFYKNRIEQIEKKEELNFYISETNTLIQKYKEILSTPIRVSFTGKVINDNSAVEKEKIVSEYLKIAKKYYNMDAFLPKQAKKKTPQKPKSPVCSQCKNDSEFENVENEYICVYCGITIEGIFNATSSSYRDIDRINLSTRYTYDRKTHFRDCINQYQGKQNCTIEKKVYVDLEEQFKQHHLLVGNEKTDRKERFSKIQKSHIMTFLKELDYAKHYENINLIHYNLTGIKPDDISHLEEKLLIDFDILLDIYDTKFRHKIDRTNFINTQYVLFQLLQRHKHPCKKEDFIMIKTSDRKTFHDDICKEIFMELGWNFTFVV